MSDQEPSYWVLAIALVLGVIGLKLLFLVDTDRRAEWLTGGATAVLALAAIAALAVALNTLGDATRTRHAALVTDISRRWGEPEATESRLLFSQYSDSALLALIDRIYDPARPQFPSALQRTQRAADLVAFGKLLVQPTLIESLGLLEKEGAISRGVIYELWGPPIVSTWMAWRTPIRAMRDAENREGVFACFYNLASEMRTEMAAREGILINDADWVI